SAVDVEAAVRARAEGLVLQRPAFVLAPGGAINRARRGEQVRIARPGRERLADRARGLGDLIIRAERARERGLRLEVRAQCEIGARPANGLGRVRARVEVEAGEVVEIVDTAARDRVEVGGQG